jgi:hypothetical protein
MSSWFGQKLYLSLIFVSWHISYVTFTNLKRYPSITTTYRNTIRFVKLEHALHDYIPHASTCSPKYHYGLQFLLMTSFLFLPYLRSPSVTNSLSFPFPLPFRNNPARYFRILNRTHTSEWMLNKRHIIKWILTRHAWLTAYSTRNTINSYLTRDTINCKFNKRRMIIRIFNKRHD